MKEDYVFPYDNWYLKFEEYDRELIDNWRINIVKFSNKPCPTNYIYYSGLAGWDGRWGGEEITIDQFKQYVLNINSESTLKEDYSYLIPLIQKL